MTDRRKAILVEAARDLAEMQEGSDAGWGLWYDWLDTVVRKVEGEAGEEYVVREATVSGSVEAPGAVLLVLRREEMPTLVPSVWSRVNVRMLKGDA